MADDAVRTLGGMEEILPWQWVGVAQLCVVVNQDQTSTDAAQRPQPERLDVQILDGQWKHTPEWMEREKMKNLSGKQSFK